MTHSHEDQPAVPLRAVVMALVICGCAVWWLLPNPDTLLKRQVLDGSDRKALETLRSLPKATRASDPAYYARTELALELKLVDARDPKAVRTLVDRAIHLLKEFPENREGLDEARRVLGLITPSEYDTLSNRVTQLPPVLASEAFRQFSAGTLAEGNPARAAAFLIAGVGPHPADRADALQLVRLWRFSGLPARAAEVVETRLAKAAERMSIDDPEMELLRIHLRRELGKPAEALDAIVERVTRTQELPEGIWLDLALQTARESSRLPDVAVWFRRAAEREPNNARTWTALAELASQAGDLPLAMHARRNLQRLNPADRQNLEKLAQYLEWDGKPGEAFDLYLRALQLGSVVALDRLLALNPGLYRDLELATALHEHIPASASAPQRRQIIQLFARVGDLEQAIRGYEQLDAEKLATADDLFEWARHLLDVSEFEKADALFSRLLANKQKPKDARHGVAEAKFRKGQFVDALREYRRLGVEENDPVALEHFIALAESLGRLDDIVDGLERRFTTLPNPSPRDYLQLAFRLNQHGQSNRRIEVLKLGVSAIPTNDTLRMALTFALSETGDYVAAQHLLASHGALRAEVEVARLYLGLLVRAQRYPEASAFLRSVTARQILDDPGFLEATAQVHEANSEKRLALDCYQRLSRADPKVERHVMNTARLLSDTGRFDEAQQLMQPFLLKPTPEVHQLAAQVYSAAGKHRLAEEHQRAFLASSARQSATAWGFLGDILLSKGDKTNARRAYRKAVDQLLASNPTSDPEVVAPEPKAKR